MGERFTLEEPQEVVPTVPAPQASHSKEMLDRNVPLAAEHHELLDIRKKEIDRLAAAISGSKDSLVIGTVARSGNTSAMQGIASALRDRGFNVAVVSAEFTLAKEVLTKLDKDKIASSILLIDEAANLKKNAENQEYLKELTTESGVRLVLFVHDALDGDGKDGSVEVAQTLKDVSSTENPQVLHLETMDRAGVRQLFDTYMKEGGYPPELLAAADEISNYVWGPLQLNAFMGAYLRGRGENRTHEDSMNAAKNRVVYPQGYDALADVFRTTAQGAMQDLVKLVGENETGIKIDELSEAQKKLVDRFDYTNIFERTGGVVKLQARCLYDYVAGKNYPVEKLPENKPEEVREVTPAQPQREAQAETATRGGFDGMSNAEIVALVESTMEGGYAASGKAVDYSRMTRAVEGTTGAAQKLKAMDALATAGWWRPADLIADGVRLLIKDSPSPQELSARTEALLEIANRVAAGEVPFDQNSKIFKEGLTNAINALGGKFEENPSDLLKHLLSLKGEERKEEEVESGLEIKNTPRVGGDVTF